MPQSLDEEYVNSCDVQGTVDRMMGSMRMAVVCCMSNLPHTGLGLTEAHVVQGIAFVEQQAWQFMSTPGSKLHEPGWTALLDAKNEYGDGEDDPGVADNPKKAKQRR